MKAPAPRGRGAADNPPNRFHPLALHHEREEGEDPDPGTTYLRDESRSVIARNDSPDVGFETSLNPYRGCVHGCAYCLDGATPILMGDGTVRPLQELRAGDLVYGTVRRGQYRRYVRTRVLACWRVNDCPHRITLRDGTSLLAGPNHRFLTRRGWKFVTGADRGHGRRPHLTTNDSLLGVGAFYSPPSPGPEYVVRKKNVEGRAVKSGADLRVVGIEPLAGPMPLCDITTGTGDFIANGVVSHNCYARPTHEYFGFSAGLDFETKILVKERAPELLRSELASPRWTPQTLVLSGVTDPYQPVERRLRITRRCLEVLAEFRNPASVITKGDLVARDADVLADLAADRAAAVTLSVTTLDAELARRMEPRASTPARRLAAIERLARAGVPVGVNVAPLIPGLNDHELPGILVGAAAAGASFAGWTLLRLPHGVAGLFGGWLERHFPERRAKVLGRLREARGGRLNDPRFGSRMRGEGEYAEHLARLFRVAARKAGLSTARPALSAAAFRRPVSGTRAARRPRGGMSADETGSAASQLDIFG